MEVTELFVTLDTPAYPTYQSIENTTFHTYTCSHTHTFTHTHHSRDAVATQVELRQRVQASQIVHPGDVVVGQVQHTELTQVGHILYAGDLGEKRRRTHTVTGL